MSRRPRPRPRLALAAAAGLATSVVLTACGGGASDVAGGAGGSAGNGSKGTIHLYAYSAPKPGYDKEIPAFNASSAGKGVAFEQSYGASGDQSRKVSAGAVADVVSFSLESDIT